MSHGIAQAFYKGSRWIKCRDGYMSYMNYVCERCGAPAEICHHKIYLNEGNIHDPFIALDWDNLEALCQDCHNREHFQTNSTREGLTFDADGNIRKEKASPVIDKRKKALGTDDGT